MKPDGYSAFLFDCDGTIADSMPLHFEAWNSSLARWNAFLTLDLHFRWAGTPTRRIVELLNEKYGWSVPPDEFTQLKEETYLKLMPTVKPVASVLKVIEDYHGKIPFAVVSGSSRETVRETLRALGLLDRFEYIVGAEDYSHGKPAPDCFLMAASQLQIDPRRCLAFEDAELGVQAARAAGMDCAVVNSKTGALQFPVVRD